GGAFAGGRRTNSRGPHAPDQGAYGLAATDVRRGPDFVAANTRARTAGDGRAPGIRPVARPDSGPERCDQASGAGLQGQSKSFRTPFVAVSPPGRQRAACRPPHPAASARIKPN